MAYMPVSTSWVVWTNDLPLATLPRLGNMTIGAMTSTMPNAHTTQPMMNNARYDSNVYVDEEYFEKEVNHASYTSL